MTKRHLTIATRKSPLAMRQAEWVKDQLLARHPALEIDLLGITTTADKILDISLTKIGGKGLFIKELEEALEKGRADIAVHSMKDVPMELPFGFITPVICKREDARDVFIAKEFRTLSELPPQSIIGTSSLRRESQLHALRHDFIFKTLRGNINTRLKRLEEGDYSAIILAAAGLKRLNLDNKIKSYLSIDECLPAAGQGALGIECLEDNQQAQLLIAPLNDTHTQACVLAERALCRSLGGGCEVPIAAYATIQKNILTLRGLVAGKHQVCRVESSGPAENAEIIGIQVAEKMRAQGVDKLLHDFAE